MLDYAGLCWSMLDYAGVCWTMLDYAGYAVLCWSILGYALVRFAGRLGDAAWRLVVDLAVLLAVRVGPRRRRHAVRDALLHESAPSAHSVEPFCHAMSAAGGGREGAGWWGMRYRNLSSRRRG